MRGPGPLRGGGVVPKERKEEGQIGKSMARIRDRAVHHVGISSSICPPQNKLRLEGHIARMKATFKYNQYEWRTNSLHATVFTSNVTTHQAMPDAVLIAVVPGRNNDTLHPHIVIGFSFFLRLRASKAVAHGHSCRLEDNFLNSIVKDFTAVIPTR